MIYIYPTDTSYALGCDARDSASVKKIFEIKGRAESKTLPLIAADIAMARQWCDLSGKAEELAQKYWPGPLTLVLPLKKQTLKQSQILKPSTSAGRQVQDDEVQSDDLSSSVLIDGCAAIRVPDCETARNLSQEIGAPIVSTSANKSGDKNSYSVEEARASLGDKMSMVDRIIDIGALEKKEPSTIVKIEGYEVRVLRKGKISIL